jgi:hypothetical protein
MTVPSRILATCAMFALVLAVGAQALAQEAGLRPVSHDLEGRGECLMCHNGMMEAIPGVPESHEGRTNQTCLWCHAPDSPLLTTQPKAIPHEVEVPECLMCHTAGMMEDATDVPTSHEGRGNEHCQMCHKAPS